MNICHIKRIGLLVSLFAAMSVQAQVVPIDKTSQKVDLGFGVELSEFLSTAATTTISGEELQQTSAISLAEALYGKLLGLNAFQKGGFVGDEDKGASFNIRGHQTFSEKDILILVDGYERPIDRLTVEEVESVTVLKDAAALAMLGHEAINGAILVKTKKGIAGPARVKVGYSRKFTFDPEFAPMLDAYNYASALNKARENDGLAHAYSSQELDLFRTGSDPFFFPNVNWRDVAFKNSAFENRANISIFGGNDRVQYYSMLDYTGAHGLLKGTQQDVFDSQLKYSKANIRTNVDFSLSPTTKMSVNVLGVFIETNRPAEWGSTADDITWNVLATPASAFPLRTSAWENSAGEAVPSIWGGNESYRDVDDSGDNDVYYGRNVAAKIQDSGFAKTHQRQLWADAKLTQDLGFWIPGLSASMFAGYDNSSIMQESQSRGHQYGYDRYLGTIGDKNPDNIQRETYGNVETKLNFNRSLSKQWRTANAGLSLQYKTSFRGDDNFVASAVYNTKGEVLDGRHNTVYRVNWLGHVHYDLQNKYVADLSLAANGSSRNYPAKWGFSPTLSLGYIYANNPRGVLTYGKVRASAGIQHTDFQPGVDSERESLIWQEVWNGSHGNYVYGQNFSNTWGAFLDVFPSSGYVQERALKFNLGTDLRLWNALDITADVYYNNRSHIMRQASELNSFVVGIQSAWNDVGKVKSYGVEFGAKFAKKIADDFYLNASGMFTWGKSEITATIENVVYPNLSSIGKRVDEAWGLEAIGFFSDQADIDNSPRQEFSTVRPGDVKYRDVNKDGVINQNDKVGLGFSDGLPALNYAFSVGAEFKGIGVNAVFQGAGNTMKNFRSVDGVWGVLSPSSDTNKGGNRNLSVDYYNNSWDMAGADARYPRLSSQSVPNNEQDSSIWFRKINFLKLRYCELYYKLPSSLVKRIRMEGVKVYVQGQNLLSFDNVDAMDAEVLSSVYPVLKSVNVGLSVTF